MTPAETTSGGRPRERAEVGRDVGRVREAAVDAAESACAHEADPGRARDGEGAADGGRSHRALGDGDAEVARPELPRVRVEAAELVLGQPDPHLAVEDADGRRYRPGLPDGPLRREPDGDALAGREPVRHQRRLEHDDGAP